VYEQLIPAAVESEVLTYERASEVIRQAGVGAISLCSCRHKANHLGKACDAPLEVCMSLGNAARWVVAKGMARPATVDEMLRVLDQTTQLGLVHICDNVLNQPAYMCHCCGCCCTILRSIKEFGKHATHPSNFIPALDAESCTGCGSCAAACQIDAINMLECNGNEQPAVNREMCIGCGVCAAACPTGALTMSRRETIYTPPASQKEKFMRMAMEKGRLG
ncbi:MAG: ATP-binding protein, partial [Bacillota bacterium]